MNVINSNKELTSPNNISTLYITHLDTYFSKIEELKQEEDFKQIILLGELALNDKDASFTDLAKIHAQLASSYFYLGEYDLCLDHSNKCQLISEYIDEPSFLIRSLYLLSAHKRAEANLTSDLEEQKKLFTEAKSYINKAMKHFDRCDCDLLKAKVLFNGGAAHADDPNGDLGIASAWYQEAKDLFLKAEEYNDYSRTLIRLGKVYLLQKRFEDVFSLLNEINLELLPQKTRVHYHYLEAQYYIAIQNYPKASSIILDGVEMATKLSMKTDIIRFNALLKEIQDKEGHMHLYSDAIKC